MDRTKTHTDFTRTEFFRKVQGCKSWFQRVHSFVESYSSMVNLKVHTVRTMFSHRIDTGDPKVFGLPSTMAVFDTEWLSIVGKVTFKEF